jgi:hypothetical protein
LRFLGTLDLSYRMHWATRQAGLHNKPAPAGLEPGVILERHYALNWLVRFEDAEWDGVGASNLRRRPLQKSPSALDPPKTMVEARISRPGASRSARETIYKMIDSLN